MKSVNFVSKTAAATFLATKFEYIHSGDILIKHLFAVATNLSVSFSGKLKEKTTNEKGPKISQTLGSGCGSVGRAVASYTRRPQFESSHHQDFLMNIFTVNC